MGSSRCVYSEVIYCGSSEVGTGDFLTPSCLVLDPFGQGSMPRWELAATPEVSQVPGTGSQANCHTEALCPVPSSPLTVS